MMLPQLPSNVSWQYREAIYTNAIRLANFRPKHVEVPERTVTDNEQVMDASQSNPERKADQVENATVLPGIDSTWEEAQSEAADPWLDSLLTTIDPGQFPACHHASNTPNLQQSSRLSKKKTSLRAHWPKMTSPTLP